ncbi:DNA-directed RNA polymerase II core subunit [Entomophthora muscae]|uniref:DNA-directed RNA polymerase II core subunit n=1 Tax=Entomophthora muscae TaxID=34485 RepID=A0ACC2TH95_9FUNG|nr:DNA-directed RNA polymerase II core subunit [Entomophthora muscae]
MNAPDRFELFLLPDGVKKLEICGEIINMKNSCLYKIEREDHTMGNLLKMELHKDPKVKFVGYKLPHPLQHHVELYIQTEEGHSPNAAFEQAIARLLETIGMVKTRFQLALGPAKALSDKVMATRSQISVFDNDAIEKAHLGEVKHRITGRGYIGKAEVFIEDDRLFKGARDESENIARVSTHDEAYSNFEEVFNDNAAGSAPYGGNQGSHSRTYDPEDF